MLKQVIASVVVTAAFLFAAGHSDAADYVRGYVGPTALTWRPTTAAPPTGTSGTTSTYPNINPYTGNVGTRLSPSYNYGIPRSSSYPSYSYPSYSFPSYRSYSPYPYPW